MDIKKFITTDKIDTDYNKMIQLELNEIKHKSSEPDNYKCLYRVSDCDFLKPKIRISDMFMDPNILEFKSLCDENIINNLAFSGPMVKRRLDPFPSDIATHKIHKLPIKNCYTVSLINTNLKPKTILKNTADIITNDYYFIIKTSNSTFYLNKKSFASLSVNVLSHSDTLDRISLHGDDLWVSGMFILELYKRISSYDITIVDPLFGYPEDILDIYDRKKENEQTIKYLIDSVNNSEIEKIDGDRIETTFIVYKEQKYTVMEYMIYKMMEPNIHPIIAYQMKNMILYLSKYQYFRPIFFFARMIGFDKKYPAMYITITESEIEHRINIDQNVKTDSIESIYHIDMWIINHLVKTDSHDLFIDYVTRMGIIKKFGQEMSKTVDKIIDWIVTYKSSKIISLLIDCNVLSDQYRYKIIFLTQEFNLLSKEFLKKYVIRKKKIDNDQTNEKNIDDKPADEKPIDEKTEDIVEEETLSLEHQQLILNILPHIIEKSLTRSFYMVLKLCPYILESLEEDNLYNETKNINGNILHNIINDESVDILEIILKKNKNLIDEKDDQGRTPLILYAERGLGKCINKLLQYGADIEAVDNTSDTFLHKLCVNGRLDIVQTVIRNVIAIINLKNDKMLTPAMLAVINFHEEIFYILKGLNASLDETDIYGNTVYHYICASKICPSMLIVNKKNKFGFTPYDYCTIDHTFYHFQN